MIQRHQRLVITLSLWAIILLSLRATMAINNLSLIQVADAFADSLRDASFGVVLFVGLYCLRPLLLMPGTLLNFLAGMVYGFPVGYLVVMIANIASSTLTFSLSRWLVRKQPKFTGSIGKSVSFMRRHPFEAVLTLQLSYISIDFTSSIAGILHLPYRLFILGIVIGGAIGNGLGVFIGTSITGSTANGTITIQPEIIAISVMVFIISIGISTMLRRRNPDIFTAK